jgi:hypothetical protein
MSTPEETALPAVVDIPAGNGSLAVYDRISDPLMAIKVLGNSIFKSGIFGITKPEQGEVLAMQCLAEKKSPLELARTYHFINGQLAIKSDALLAKFQQAGGRVDWITRTDKLVEADFIMHGSKARIVASIEEYVANGTALANDGKMKDNWKKWPRRMLTARAIGEGVRLMAPEAAFGTYTVEEMDTGVKAAPTASNGLLSDWVPEHQRAAAVAVLRKVGHLEDGQGFDDISPELNATLTKPARRDAFLAAVRNEYEKTV